MAEYTFTDAAIAAIEDQMASRGGGILTSFVGAFEFLDADGEPNLVLMELGDQSTSRSMGLVEYLRESLATDCRQQLSVFVDGDDDDR